MVPDFFWEGHVKDKEGIWKIEVWCGWFNGCGMLRSLDCNIKSIRELPDDHFSPFLHMTKKESREKHQQKLELVKKNIPNVRIFEMEKCKFDALKKLTRQLKVGGKIGFTDHGLDYAQGTL